jgi:Dyp-type peroxidase family
MAILSRSRGQLSELTHIAPIKRGPIQQGSQVTYADRLRIALEIFNKREDQGFPSVIRLFRAIHFSKWSMIDGDTRLLLSVVFDGDLHGYLRALAYEVPGMLHMIWSNCESWEPVNDQPQKLIEFIERFQVRTNYLYAQNPDLTVPDIERLKRLRAAFDAPANASAEVDRIKAKLYDQDAPMPSAQRQATELAEFDRRMRKNAVAESKDAFQRLFGQYYVPEELALAIDETYGAAEKKPQTPVHTEQVQGNVLEDYADADCARMLFFHFEGQQQAREWLSKLRAHVTLGYPKTAGSTPYVSVGFTHEGLQALGVNPAVLSQFPTAFVEGMEARTKLLGDLGHHRGSAGRKKWTQHDEGKAECAIHAVVFVHTRSDATLRDALIAAGTAAQNQHASSASRGSTSDAKTAWNTVRRGVAKHLDLTCQALPLAGAVRLGHQDLHRPLVPDGTGKAHAVEYFGFRDGVNQPKRPPEHGYDPVLRAAPHGLLKDATFLVARQLRQDPEGFWDNIKDRANVLGESPQRLAEAIVGRGMDGAQLNDRACSFHSHVRRANPKVDSTAFRNPELARRGLSYLRERDGNFERGLMFLAFNADIESQFEFIQRNWIQGGNQVGLSSSDRDVLSGLAKSETSAGDACFFAKESSKTLTFTQPFVELEWGIYLYFPAEHALKQL